MAAKKKPVRKFSRKLPIWITDKVLHDAAKKHARAEKRSLSALAEQALRNYLSRMTVLNEIEKMAPEQNAELLLETRQKLAGVKPESWDATDQEAEQAGAKVVRQRRKLLETLAGASDAMRDPNLPVLERRKAAIAIVAGTAHVPVDERVAAVRASAQRMLGRHAKSFDELAAPAKEPLPDALERVAGPLEPEGAQQSFCRRCRHAQVLHMPTKSGQLACQLARCNCARYMA